MKCTDVERKMLEEGKELSEEVREHLAGCPSCRQFQAILSRMGEARQVCEPSREVDAAVLQMASRELRKVREGQSAPRRVFRMLVWTAAAACAVLVAVLLTMKSGGLQPQGQKAGTVLAQAGSVRQGAVVKGEVDTDLFEWMAACVTNAWERDCDRVLLKSADPYLALGVQPEKAMEEDKEVEIPETHKEMSALSDDIRDLELLVYGM